MIYQIRDWDDHFENNKSRERDRLSFVCIPNKQHGIGFCRIMAEPDGAAIYGIWHLITGACSQQSRPRNGWLTDTGRAPAGHQPGTSRAPAGHRAGTAWIPADLALKFRRPVEEVKRALDVLSSESIGWMILHNEVPAECPPSARRVPAECPPSAQEGEGREGKEGKGREDPAAPTNHPPLSATIEYFTRNGAGYSLPEIEQCFQSFGATAVDGYWYFGKRVVTDWRDAMATRLRDIHARSPEGKKKGRAIAV